MQLTWRDAAATALTAIIVALYVAYLAGVEIATFTSVRAIAAAGLVLGLASCVVGAAPPNPGESKPTGYRWMAALGVAALLAGLLALISGLQAALAVQVAAIVLLWLFATLRHAVDGRRWEGRLQPHDDTASRGAPRVP